MQSVGEALIGDTNMSSSPLVPDDLAAGKILPNYASWAIDQALVFERYTWEDWYALAHYEPMTTHEARALAFALACFALLASDATGEDIGRFSHEQTIPLSCLAPRLRCLSGGLMDTTPSGAHG